VPGVVETHSVESNSPFAAQAIVNNAMNSPKGRA
jgi:hypothetical protein